jgi:tRNA(fMet)-specific endonuclease VapC
MSGRFLLDTNIVIALFADEAIVKNNLAQTSEVFIPSIVIGELCCGARKSGRVGANLARIDELSLAARFWYVTLKQLGNMAKLRII